jgi:hypothetical protein
MQACEIWGVPPSCQTIFFETQILHNNQSLDELSVLYGLPLQLTMLVSTSEIVKTIAYWGGLFSRGLTSEVIEVFEALQDLKTVCISQKVSMDEHDIMIVLDCLTDPGSQACFRVKILEVLAQIMEKGRQVVIERVVECLKSPCYTVKMAAAEAIAKLAESGNEHAISALAYELQIVDSHEDLLKSFRNALLQIAERNDIFAINAVAANLHGGRSCLVAWTAADILCRIAEDPAAVVIANAKDPRSCYIALGVIADHQSRNGLALHFQHSSLCSTATVAGA